MLSIGGVLRDPTGRWIIGFSKTLGVGDHVLAEILAIEHGLQISWQHGFRAIDCECDHFTGSQLAEKMPIKFVFHLRFCWFG